MNKLVLFTLCTIIAFAAAETDANVRRLDVPWWERMTGEIQETAHNIQGGWNQMVEDAQNAPAAGARRLGWWDSMANAVGGVLQGAADTVVGYAQSAGQQLWSQVSTAATNAIHDAENRLNTLRQEQVDYAQHRLETMRTLLTEQGNTLTAAARTQFQNTVSQIQREANNLITQGEGQAQTAFQNAVDNLENRVQNLVAGNTLRRRRLSPWGSAWSWASGAVSGVVDAATDAWNTVRGMYGNQIMNSFDQIRDAAANLQNHVRDDLQTRMDALGPQFQKILDSTSQQARDYVATHLPDVQQRLQTIVSHVGDGAEATMNNALANVESELNRIANAARLL